MLLDAFIVVLQLYFILMNLTVEQSYCASAFTPDDTRFLVKETIDFCSQNNRLFLARPEWMVMATCISAYGLVFGYLSIILVTVSSTWRRFSIPLLLFVGCKLNAIFFYHLMEFTDPILPPEKLVAYFAVEGPYILSMILVVYKVYNSLYSIEAKKKQQ